MNHAMTLAAWRIATACLILIVYGWAWKLPLTGNGLGVTVLWWLVGVSVVIGSVRRLAPRSLRTVAWLLYGVFGLDLGIQLVLQGFFGVMPQPAIVAEALANSNGAEVFEFVNSQWRSLTLAFAGLLMMLSLAWVECTRIEKGVSSPQAVQRSNARVHWLARAGLIFQWSLVVFFVLLHLNPTMLRGHPALRMPVYYQRYVDSVEEIKEMAAARARFKAMLSPQSIRTELSGAAPGGAHAIKILVIGESSNRSNWSLFGYERDTTAPLDKLISAHPKEFQVFPNAFSVDAFTLPSLTQALMFGEKGASPLISGPDIFQMAQAAGYQVQWLSNQPKGEGWFAAIADSADRQLFINSGNWRDSSSVDSELLPVIFAAMESQYPAPQLLVIHGLGQHFFYEQRCPKGEMRYLDRVDGVTRQLAAEGRKQSTIEGRNAYDSAVYCGAQFLRQIVTHAQDAARRNKTSIDLLYFSDHGQEVGHNADVASHSAVFQSGYKIPMLLWRSDVRASLESPQPDAYFQLDQLPHTLLNFLEIQAPSFYRANHDLFSREFVPVTPHIKEAKSLKGD